MDWIEAEELAVEVLGISEESDHTDIEDALADKLGCSFEQFREIATALMPFTITARTAITDELFHGFVKNGMFICKQKA